VVLIVFAVAGIWLLGNAGSDMQYAEPLSAFGATAAAAKSAQQCLDNGKLSIVVSDSGAKEVCKPGCVYEVQVAKGAATIRVIGYHPSEPQGTVVINALSSVVQKSCSSSGTQSLSSVVTDNTVTGMPLGGSAQQDYKTMQEVRGMETDLSAGNSAPVGADSWVCGPGDNGPSCGGDYYGNVQRAGAAAPSPAANAGNETLPVPPVPPSQPPPAAAQIQIHPSSDAFGSMVETYLSPQSPSLAQSYPDPVLQAPSVAPPEPAVMAPQIQLHPSGDAFGSMVESYLSPQSQSLAEASPDPVFEAPVSQAALAANGGWAAAGGSAVFRSPWGVLALHR
jgi:hypothetical protein